MQISPLDLGGRDALTEVTDLVRASVERGAPWLHRPSLDQPAGAPRHGHDGEPALTFLGRVDGSVRAFGSLHLSSWDNLDAAWWDRSRAIPRRQHLGDDLVDRVRRIHAEASVAAQDHEVPRWWGRTPGPLRVRGSEMATERRGRSLQLDTTVVPRHRGHRLGLLMKTGLLLWLAEAQPQLRTVDTWNAESNTHMVAVNESLGYTWTARQVQYQKGGG